MESLKDGKLLIQNIEIHDPLSDYHGESVDVLLDLDSDRVLEISNKIKPSNEMRAVDFAGASLSRGWFDIGTEVGEPGFEYRETFESLSRSASFGGFTNVAVFPNTNPILDNAAQVSFAKHASAPHVTRVHTIGACTVGLQGMDLTEMHDLAHHGCIGFSDGHQSIHNSKVMLNALEYCKAVDAVLLDSSTDRDLIADGQMHEGEHSTMLGMPGIPELSEINRVNRNINLSKYADARMVFHNLSSAKAIKAIKQSNEIKRFGIGVPYLNLVSTDSELLAFDTNYKVLPPLRTIENKESLTRCFQDGMIDYISSNHSPKNVDEKRKEFFYADFGTIGLETCFAALNSMTNLSLDHILSALVDGPRKVLGLENNGIAVGSICDFTIFDPKSNWKYTTIQSKSANSPFVGKKFTGQVLSVINKGQFFDCRQ